MSVKEMFDDILYKTKGPIITWPGQEDTLTEVQIRNASIQRMLKYDFSDKMATDYDVALYLMTASLAGPLNNSQFKAYKFVLNKCMPELVDKHGIESEPLDEEEVQALEKLKKWLFKKQMEAMKK